MSTPSLSLNPPLSPPPPLFSPSPTPSPTPSSYTPTTTSRTSLSPLRSHQPTYPLPTKSQFLLPKRSNCYNKLTRSPFAAASNMTITSNMTTTDLRLQERDHLLLDSEVNSARPRRIALFVEPSPFAYVSGYKNRFQNFIKYLREMGDEVLVVTTHEGVPREFLGAKVIGSQSFPCPFYQNVPLSLALSPRIISEVAQFKPDIIHSTSPGIMVFGALIIAKLLCVPLVLSYHTHLPVYIPRYTSAWLVKPMWGVIKFLHGGADLTLVPSAALAKELEDARVTEANKIRVWNKGVDSKSFHPQYCSHEMRLRLSNGDPEKPLIVHVGRLGKEKSLDLLKRVMDKLPGVRIAFIGDGPYRGELEKMFSDMPAVFTGMLGGEELSRAYASGDVFLMPSESETLGLVVLEAMSSGLPVVAARAGGIIDIIPQDHEDKTGFCFNPGDVDDCVRKLKPLLENRELRANIGKAAREEMEKYDWKAATQKIRDEQYRDAIWFWRNKRPFLLRPFQWLFRWIFKAPEVNYSCFR
ncbi:sulfoquinovosyl transferase SQD2-like isoform X2 [Rhododendron vialii]|uniref:sulfoquinovosyl transferase SQD2-like isoform X2 n=1 Tax=Rhododendron vialii TaxID=182163 RepID=UPI00265FE5B4|nr:sulfoquinovosyl transferase SQD2-like isoform X2 [Rhododendron vialii]